MRLSIQSSNPSLSGELQKAQIEGIKISFVPPKLALDSALFSSLFDITFVSGASVPVILLGKWLYNKLKEKPNEKTVINGNQINIKTMTVIQITQIISGSSNDGKDKGKSD